MADTEYSDLETALMNHLLADAWLGSSANVKLIHRFPYAYLPSYRQGQLPAISIAVESEAAETRVAQGVIDRHIQVGVEIIEAGGQLGVLSAHGLQVLARARQWLRWGSLPTSFVGIIHDLAVQEARSEFGLFPNNQYVWRGSFSISVLRIDESDAVPAGDPSIDPDDEITDVATGVQTALSTDAALVAATGSILSAPHTFSRNDPQALFPRIEVFVEQEQHDTSSTFIEAERIVPVRIAITHRGGELSGVEQTIKTLLAGVRRVMRREALKTAPIGGAAVDMENRRMRIIRGAAQSQDENMDAYTIIGITDAAAVLAA